MSGSIYKRPVDSFSKLLYHFLIVIHNDMLFFANFNLQRIDFRFYSITCMCVYMCPCMCVLQKCKVCKYIKWCVLHRYMQMNAFPLTTIYIGVLQPVCKSQPLKTMLILCKYLLFTPGNRQNVSMSKQTQRSLKED